MFILISSSRLALANEVVIAGNGSNSTNDIQSSSTQVNESSQSNTQDTSNNFTISGTTGGNSVSDTTGGDSRVDTGDVDITTDVTNTGNANIVTAGCCEVGQTSTTITNNGTDSDNSITLNGTQSSVSTGTNTLSITNTIRGIANTGGNTGSSNSSGNVYIKTGNITVVEKITNGPLNINYQESTLNTNKNYAISIKGNGSASQNNASITHNVNNDITVNNTANIINDILWILDTGNNIANNNTKSNVTIETGDIFYFAKVVNGPINVNIAKVTCCEEKPEEQKPPTGGVQPTTPPSTSDSKPSESKSSSNGKGGDVLGTSIQKILPATGNYNLLLFLIGNIAMFFLGVTLRLRSGRSPATV